MSIYVGRRQIRWEKVRGPRAVTGLVVATALGAGLLPLAPGSFGTLMGVPLAYFTAGAPDGARFAMWLALTLVGIWAGSVMDETNDTKDNQNIVIDEVVGFGITAWTAGTNPLTLLAAFFFFRVFDILKPPPVRQLDKWSRNKEKGKSLWNGFGVMIDDVVAGFQGLAVILLLQHFGILD